MGLIEGIERGQTTFWSLEDMIGEENLVRVIDRYVDICDLNKMRFTRVLPKTTGRLGFSANVVAVDKKRG